MAVERPLSKGLPVKKGQTILRTECSICGQVSRNPTKAAAHVLRHRAQKPKVAPQLPEQGGYRPQNGGKVAGLPVPDEMICRPDCLDRGALWWVYPCICNCHFVGQTARRMIKAQAEAD